MADKTLTYSQGAEGWPSFYSFVPDWMIGMNNYFYSFKGGNLYRHNTNGLRCNFYGVQYEAKLQSVFNDLPLENKLFKTLNLEGSDSWDARMFTDIQDSGFINKPWFEKKEGSWYAFVRNEGTIPAAAGEYALRSINGIGKSSSVTDQGASAIVNFAIGQSPIQIGNIISVGDILYYTEPPFTGVPKLFGQVTEIDVNYLEDKNRIFINTALPGIVMPVVEDPYVLYVKNSVAESHGVLGHYCVFTLVNGNSSKVELFAAESEVMKSYP
jgi:hypothetical protein